MAAIRRKVDELPCSILPPGANSNMQSAASLDRSAYEYERALAEVQRFRGRIYLADGAIPQSALDCTGRHCMDGDRDSWHLLIKNKRDELCGCIRIRLFSAPVDIAELHIAQTVSRLPHETKLSHLRALKRLRDLAASAELLFGEAGGWAVGDELRNSSAGVTLAVAVWPLCRMLGGAIAVAAATARHGSADILARLGGTALSDGQQPLQSFYDDYFRCEMHVMSFDSRRLSERYEQLALNIHAALAPLIPVKTNNYQRGSLCTRHMSL